MKKIIVIDTEKKYIKFKRRLFLYRSLLYKNVFFDVKNDIDIDDLDLIVKALNIKNRSERIAFIHDTACDFIDEKMMGCSACDFKNDKCFIQRRDNIDRINGCCHCCPYQVNKKCTTKNISCKLFFCPSVKRKVRIIKIKDVDILKLFSIRQKIIC